jgi:hypothetical protein
VSETTTPKQAQRISEESATAQIVKLYEAFEVPLDVEGSDGIRRPDPLAKKLAEAVVKGRFEVNGEGDEIQVKQHLRREIGGQKMIAWNWSRLGMGKARVKIGSDGVVPYGQSYTTAAPMIGHEAIEIQKMHPVDLSLVEDIAAFFQKI